MTENSSHFTCDVIMVWNEITKLSADFTKTICVNHHLAKVCNA